MAESSGRVLSKLHSFADLFAKGEKQIHRTSTCFFFLEEEGLRAEELKYAQNFQALSLQYWENVTVTMVNQWWIFDRLVVCQRVP